MREYVGRTFRSGRLYVGRTFRSGETVRSLSDGRSENDPSIADGPNAPSEVCGDCAIDSDAGSALLIALAAAALMAALGVGLIGLSNAETVLTARVAEGHELVYAAEAGLERAVAALRLTPWNGALNGTAPAAFQGGGAAARPSGQPVDLPAATARLQAEAASLWGAGTVVWRLYGNAPVSAISGLPDPGRDVYVAVWIADDPVEGDADPATDTNATVLLRSMAFGTGRTERTVTATVAHDNPGAGGSQIPSQGGMRVISWREKR